MEKLQKRHQNLIEWYGNLQREIPPKKAFINEVAEKCGVERDSVKVWLMGRSKPSKPEYYDILSEITGIPKNELFGDEKQL